MTILSTGGRYCFWRTISGPDESLLVQRSSRNRDYWSTYRSPSPRWRQCPRHRYRCSWDGWSAQLTPMFALRPWDLCMSFWGMSGPNNSLGKKRWFFTYFTSFVHTASVSDCVRGELRVGGCHLQDSALDAVMTYERLGRYEFGCFLRHDCVCVWDKILDSLLV